MRSGAAVLRVLWIAAWLLAGGRGAAAQINIEPFSLGMEEEGFQVEVGANFSMEANDTVLLEVDLSPRFDYVWGDYSASLVSTVGFSERAGTTFRNLFLINGRYLLKLRSTLSLEVFARVQRDAFASLNQRLIGGAGMRLQIAADSQAATYAGVSLGLEGEQWEVTAADNHPRTVRSLRGISYLAYRIQLTETATLLNTVSVALRLAGALDDVRFTDAATLQVNISEQVALNASFGLEYDSHPPQTQPKVGLVMKHGLAVKF